MNTICTYQCKDGTEHVLVSEHHVAFAHIIAPEVAVLDGQRFVLFSTTTFLDESEQSAYLYVEEEKPPTPRDTQKKGTG